MTWCANAVGSLPGAVGHIREIPTIAFALMLTGGVLAGALANAPASAGCRCRARWTDHGALDAASRYSGRPERRTCRRARGVRQARGVAGAKARSTISIAGSNMMATTGALRKRSIQRRSRAMRSAASRTSRGPSLRSRAIRQPSLMIAATPMCWCSICRSRRTAPCRSP